MFSTLHLLCVCSPGRTRAQLTQQEVAVSS